MVGIFEMFKISRMLKFKDGEILISETPFVMLGTNMFVAIQKEFINEISFENGSKIVYEKCKENHKEFVEKLKKKKRFKNERSLMEWVNKIIALTGWGNPEIMKYDDAEIIVKIDNSPYPEEYGKADYNCCFITAGFLAGIASAACDEKYECTETICKANKGKYCEFRLKKKIKARK